MGLYAAFTANLMHQGFNVVLSCRSVSGCAETVLVRHSRLSVGPVAPAEWQTICKIAGIDA